MRYDLPYGNDMKQRPRVLVTVSALLLAAVVALWARSYQVADALERRDLVPNDTNLRALSNVSHLERQRGIISSRGAITWAKARNVPLRVHSRDFGRWIFTDGGSIWVREYARQKTLLRRLGFVFENHEPAIPLRTGIAWTPSTVITIPYWFPAFCLAIAPTLYLLRRLRAWLPHRRAGLCRHCGYDLRATPDRCPECGATPPTATVTAQPSPR
jgi:hypothetical protein